MNTQGTHARQLSLVLMGTAAGALVLGVLLWGLQHRVSLAATHRTNPARVTAAKLLSDGEKLNTASAAMKSLSASLATAFLTTWVPVLSSAGQMRLRGLPEDPELPGSSRLRRVPCMDFFSFRPPPRAVV